MIWPFKRPVSPFAPLPTRGYALFVQEFWLSNGDWGGLYSNGHHQGYLMVSESTAYANRTGCQRPTSRGRPSEIVRRYWRDRLDADGELYRVETTADDPIGFPVTIWRNGN